MEERGGTEMALFSHHYGGGHDELQNLLHYLQYLLLVNGWVAMVILAEDADSGPPCRRWKRPSVCYRWSSARCC